MVLKDARGDFFGDFSANGLKDRVRFARAARKDQDLFCFHNAFRSHRKGAAGNFVLALEEAGIHLDRVLGQRNGVRFFGERSSRLVESDMPVRADPEDLQIARQ